MERMKGDTKQENTSQVFTRRDFISISMKTSAAAFTTSLLPNLNVAAEERYNVLFIMVDDLRPLLGCYGHSEMHTPNIDKLAQRGTVFNRAYCQFPVCNPSRASILTGLRPETIGVRDLYTHYRDTVPHVVTLPQYFLTYGYHTRSIGKILHGSFVDSLSWSVPAWQPSSNTFHDDSSWNSLNVSDDELRDGKVAKQTVDVLEELRDKQFFLSVGFYKPHLPFNVPTKYYDLYDSPIIENVPDVFIHPLHEMVVYSDMPSEGGKLSKEKTLELIRGYAASTSFMDAQVGRVLDHLDELGLTDKTVIVFVSDHGFHLGEHGTFGKRTPYEVSVRSPLIVSYPRQLHVGVKTEAIVELVDIYPTLCDLCQLPIPEGLEGISMGPVIEKPTHTWKTAAFSQVDIAFSIHTKQYRYTETIIGSQVLGKGLYDHYVDPAENINLANLLENAEIVASLRERLREGWQEALPDILKQLNPPPQTLSWDINNDGIVDVEDLLIVSNNFGTESPDNPKVDVNEDGNVNIIDLLIVAAHLGESSNKGAPKTISIAAQHINQVAKWISDARKINDASPIYQKGIKNLQMLMNSVVPNETRLLPNYPNPFNPETWIPYDLDQDAHVSIHIYNLQGEFIRHLKVGFQNAGSYRNNEMAAHWDGRNSAGEPVASGIYFYTLIADNVIATRRMTIVK
ncbi:sulfatase-like hydrolase/transferase [Candidatus Poribacteria bacterium]|nr:sulfatase-like hydrolase/transferase [Candidatus Poribacteria bacterium]